MQNSSIAQQERENETEKMEKCEFWSNQKKGAAICACGRAITINNLAPKASLRSLDH